MNRVELIERGLHVPPMEVPAGWQWFRLDELCHGVFDCPHSTPELTEQGPYVVRTQDIITGIFRTDQAAHVSEQTYHERVSRVVPTRGDLLYSREGTYFGIAAEVPERVKVCLGQRMVLIRPNPKLVSFRYLRYWLNSSVMASHISGFRDGTVAERLNLPTIRALAVLCPPLKEQLKISEILNSLDDKIELNRRMNETLESMARALFKSWFVDFDPVRAKIDGRLSPGIDSASENLFPDHFQDSSMGSIPKGWKVGRLDEIAMVIMGLSPDGDSYNADGIGTPLINGPVEFGEYFPIKSKWTQAATRFAVKGDLIFCVRGSTTGRRVVSDDTYCIGRGVCAIRAKDKIYSFLYQTINFGLDSLLQKTTGSVFPNLSSPDIKEFSVLRPTSEILELFESATSSLVNKIQLNHREICNLTKLRETLLPWLLSGET